MKILLPPSETKRVGGAQDFAPAELAYDEGLGEVRDLVRAALEHVSADEASATRALKLGVKNRDERLRNLELDASGAMPAIERYTGVLYDALNAAALHAEARQWIDAHVYVQSALYGLLRAHDAIPAYRLSGSSRLPSLGSPLKRVWADPHSNLLDGTNYVLDLRSQDYAALAPVATLGAREFDVLEVVARGSDGEVRALNHFNKAAKGDLVRRLAVSGAVIKNRDDLIVWAAEEGLELVPSGGVRIIRLVTEQGVPASNR